MENKGRCNKVHLPPACKKKHDLYRITEANLCSQRLYIFIETQWTIFFSCFIWIWNLPQASVQLKRLSEIAEEIHLNPLGLFCVAYLTKPGPPDS